MKNVIVNLFVVLALFGCGQNNTFVSEQSVTETTGTKRMQFPGHIDDSFTDNEGNVFKTYIDFTEESDSELVTNYQDYGRLASIVYETHKELGRPNNAKVLKNLKHWYILVVHNDNQFRNQYAWGKVTAFLATQVSWRPRNIPGKYTMVCQNENFRTPHTLIHEMLHAVMDSEVAGNGTHDDQSVWNKEDPNSMYSIVMEKFGIEDIQ